MSPLRSQSDQGIGFRVGLEIAVSGLAGLLEEGLGRRLILEFHRCRRQSDQGIGFGDGLEIASADREGLLEEGLGRCLILSTSPLRSAI
jgi:hypothetical protein